MTKRSGRPPCNVGDGIVRPLGLGLSSFQNSDLIRDASLVTGAPVPLPHAPPMHWLDAATLAADNLTVTAIRTITAGHPFVKAGEFLPAALIELMAQAAAAGAILKARRSGKFIRRGVLAALRDLRISGALQVGDTAVIRGVEEQSFGCFTSARLETRVGGCLIAQAHMTFHLLVE